ncbi:MAG: AAA family ATPase [Gemmatimonadota bacterium]|nr:AAA family ATPase [Gemmatimonadota bacterium]
MQELIEALSSPEAYAHPVDEIEVRQTHISAVFLAGDFAYKVKKPVELGFLDFTTLGKREHYCREEVRLNRRLAPDVYLGISTIVDTRQGWRLRSEEEVEADEEIVEWAVRMRRLPEGRTLERWVEEGRLRPYHVAVVGRRIAAFHDDAESSPAIRRWGRFETVARNARENLEQARTRFDEALEPALLRRLKDALERELSRLEPLITSRAERGVPVDTHGDLRLDHVYVFGDRDPPGDIVIIDCIEFNERFRYADPVADMAFLDMDLRYHGRDDLATAFDDAYFEAAGDREGRALLPFYSAYRAAVRAKVSGMSAEDGERSAEERAASAAAERAHWLLALTLLEPPRRRPGLALVGGLPGTGKSTLADALGERAGFRVLSSDRVRKELAGLDPERGAGAAFGEGLYTAEWNERTYDELLRRAEALLLEGSRVLVDASFREEGFRAAFLELAAELRVRSLFLLLEVPPERARARIRSRPRGASDADTDIYEAAAARWEPPAAATETHTRRVDTGQSRMWSVEQSLAHLRERELL